MAFCKPFTPFWTLNVVPSSFKVQVRTSALASISKAMRQCRRVTSLIGLSRSRSHFNFFERHPSLVSQSFRVLPLVRGPTLPLQVRIEWDRTVHGFASQVFSSELPSGHVI